MFSRNDIFSRGLPRRYRAEPFAIRVPHNLGGTEVDCCVFQSTDSGQANYLAPCCVGPYTDQIQFTGTGGQRFFGNNHIFGVGPKRPAA